MPNKSGRENFVLNVNVLEGRHYIWPDMNSAVLVKIDNQKRASRVEKGTDSPYYNEFFFFEFTSTVNEMVDKILTFTVIRPHSLCKARKFLGYVSLDLGTIWQEPDHQFFHKWLILSGYKNDSSSVGIRGYLKVDLFILCKGESPKIPLIDLDETDEIEGNLLLPGHLSERQKANYIFTIYKGETMVKEKYSVPGNKDKNDKCSEDGPTTFIEVHFVGLKARTTVKKHETAPIWNERLVLNELFPPLCQRIKILLYHKHGRYCDTMVAENIIDIRAISNEHVFGFLPTFGPAYVYFYFKNESYAGKLLVSIRTHVIDYIAPTVALQSGVEHISTFSEEQEWTYNTVVLHICIFDVNMIYKSFSKKPISFEASMGGLCQSFYTADKTYTISMPTVPLEDKKNWYLQYEQEKPSIEFQSIWPDFRGRLHLSNKLDYLTLLLQLKIQELVKLFEVFRYIPPAENDIEQKLEETKHALIAACQQYLKTEVSVRNPWNTPLDRQRERLCKQEIASILRDCRWMNTKVDKMHSFRMLENMHYRLKQIAGDVQRCWPDVIVWMLYDGKRVGCHKVSPRTILHSEVHEEKGKLCGVLHSVFFKFLGKLSSSTSFPCRMDLVMWIGTAEQEKEWLKCIPEGFSVVTSPTETQVAKALRATDSFEFICRIHILVARIVPGQESTGLCNPYVMVTIEKFRRTTKVMPDTLNPYWKQMIVIPRMTLYGSKESLKKFPPVAVFEIFDKRKCRRTKSLIGRVEVTPYVAFRGDSRQSEIINKYEVFQEGEKAAEVLVGVELLEAPEEQEEELGELNVDEVASIPPEILRPSTMHRVAICFWGLRDLKKVGMSPINMPRIVANMAYASATSTTIPDAKTFSNFSNPYTHLDVEIPHEREFTPPLLFTMYDSKSFGRTVYAGATLAYSLQFLYQPLTKQERARKMGMVDQKCKLLKNKLSRWRSRRLLSELLKSFLRLFKTSRHKEDIEETRSSSKLKLLLGQRNLDKQKTLIEEQEDWWTKYYSAGKIPAYEIYDSELESQPEFQNFTDLITPFPLYKGRRTGDDEVDSLSVTGVLKASAKIYSWPPTDNKKYVTPEGYPAEEGVFQHYFPNEEIKFVVRVYVVRAMGLPPKDRTGKSDPFIVVTLGKTVINDSEHYIPKQLNPIFGKCFELRGKFPEDYLLKVAIWDHDRFTTNDFIGETEIDLENRLYSKHRGSCGLAGEYMEHGPHRWRDQRPPTQLLERWCTRFNVGTPEYFDTYVRLASKEFHITKYYDKEKIRRENLALAVLRRWHEIPLVGTHIVQEHVETRSLYHPSAPGIEQVPLSIIAFTIEEAQQILRRCRFSAYN